MVKFFLVSTDDNIATYEYYPEDDRSKECGIITLDIVSGKTLLKRLKKNLWIMQVMQCAKLKNILRKVKFPKAE